jgi:phosphatidate cytidylyltransferase
VAVAGMLGDLAESLLKRDLGVKDSSTWMPGFGGVLDLLDSILFAAPVAYLCLLLELT